MGTLNQDSGWIVRVGSGYFIGDKWGRAPQLWPQPLRPILVGGLWVGSASKSVQRVPEAPRGIGTGGGC